MQDKNEKEQNNENKEPERRIYLGRFGSVIDGYALGTVLAENMTIFHKLGFAVVLDCRNVISIGQNALRGLRAELTCQGDALGFKLTDVHVRCERAEPNVTKRIMRALNQDNLDPQRRFETSFKYYRTTSYLQGFIDSILETNRKRLEAIQKQEEESECPESFAISY